MFFFKEPNFSHFERQSVANRRAFRLPEAIRCYKIQCLDNDKQPRSYVFYMNSLGKVSALNCISIQRSLQAASTRPDPFRSLCFFEPERCSIVYPYNIMTCLIYTQTMLDVFLDESFERIDKKLWKVSVCGVEIENSEVKNSVAQVASITSDVIRFPESGKKLHFSELNDAQQSQIVEVVSKLPIAAKTYTYYILGENEPSAKRIAMERSVRHLQHIHRSKKMSVFIEYAHEYRGSEVKDLLYRDLPAFVLPDAILSVYTKFLNDKEIGSTSSNARFYILLREKIRLQSFNLDGHREFNERDDRL